MSRAREWAVRCGLEHKAHEVACWTTLTYDDDHLPPTLQKSHTQGFLKRLRARVSSPIRFFLSGEYGERTHRPHYHAILFGLSERSQDIQKAWPFGYVRTDPLTPAAISYVAGYCSKKVGYRLEAGERLDPSTGELYDYQPPFLLMSRRPGIGGHMRQHWRSWRTTAISNGIEIPVPRFLHQSWLKNTSPEQHLILQHEKLLKQSLKDTSKPRLEAGHLIAVAKHSLSSSKRTQL